jgi:transcriptional regulator with XRE-family HTH domain
MPPADNALGEFLRARRELVDPADVGVRDLGRRRVAGLRREELAMLAGVSIDYYTRLEQGRDRHPSPQVLEALARALQLDDDALEHLRRLVEPTPRRRAPARRPERVRPGVERMLDGLSAFPALVLGRYRDVLAANPTARALSPSFRVGGNTLRFVFLDPAARDFYLDWEDVARDAVASLRGAVGTDLDDPRLTDLVGELSLKSEDFRRLWARHDVRTKRGGRKRFRNPLVGEIALTYESLQISGTDGQTLVVYSAAAGSADEQALALLAAIAAGDEPSAAIAGPHVPQ